VERNARSLVLRISIVARLMRISFDERARSVGVTRAQWRTIATVRFAPGSTQREIAEMLEVREVTAGRHIDRLCEQGWAERRPDASDRRVHRIYLTPSATPLLEQLDALGEAEQVAALAGFDDDEIALFESFLARMSDNLGSPGFGCLVESEDEETGGWARD
jgi:MarR family transcriptional regulator, transcriptional regulator for hemolysin